MELVGQISLNTLERNSKKRKDKEREGRSAEKKNEQPQQRRNEQPQQSKGQQPKGEKKPQPQQRAPEGKQPQQKQKPLSNNNNQQQAPKNKQPQPKRPNVNGNPPPPKAPQQKPAATTTPAIATSYGRRKHIIIFFGIILEKSSANKNCSFKFSIYEKENFSTGISKRNSGRAGVCSVNYSSTSVNPKGNPGGIYIKGGDNFSNISTSNDGSYRDGNMLSTFNVGVIADLPLSTLFSIQPGLVLNGKGSKVTHYYSCRG